MKLATLIFLKLTLPINLYNKIKESSEICNITGIEKLLDELKSIDPAKSQLAHHFKHSLEQFDMDTINSILNKIKPH
jgi:hypothetical protein